MKPIKITIICGALCTCLTTHAFARCAAVGMAIGQTCADAGGVYCSDGGCWACCDDIDGGGTSTTPCSGISTSSQTSFSDVKGSGYIPVTTYRKDCKCLER